MSPLLLRKGILLSGSRFWRKGLVHYWRLDEAAATVRADLVGDAPLAPTNSPASIAGQRGNGLQTAVTGSKFVSIADRPSLSIGGQSCSIAFWTNPPNLNVNRLISKWGSGTDEYVIYIDGAPRFNFTAVNPTAGAVGAQATNFGSPVIGNWHLVIAYYDNPSKTIGISINAGTPNTALLGGDDTIRDGTNVFALGGCTAGEGYDTQMDEVMWWNRVLTAEERSLLWNGGTGLFYPS